MPSVCVCNCGLNVTDGDLCVDWTVLGMDRVCVTANLYSAVLANHPDWSTAQRVTTAWTNTTCWPHRVLIRTQVPYVRIKTGAGNVWEVRGMLRYALGGPPLFGGDEEAPDMLWTSNWPAGMPTATDQEAQTPGAARREFVVAPGEQLYATSLLQARTPQYTSRPANLLQIGATTLSLSAWPSADDAASGPRCRYVPIVVEEEEP